MTTYEGAFPTPEASTEELIGFDYILDTYGLGPAEASATVTFGEHTGTVAAMLTDERCPVGRIVAEAYKAEGLQGVEKKAAALKLLYDDFDLPIGRDTRSYHDGSLKRADLLAKASAREEPPDFLAR